VNGGILSKVFYTPVQNPDDVKCIEVDDIDNLEIINNFVRRIVNKRLKKPVTSEPRFNEEILTELMRRGLDIHSEEAKSLFEKLSKYMHGKAKEQGKYWCLIITEEYFFAYHFTPDRAVSFEEGNIREFIKYLDDASLLKFIFRLKSESLSSYFEKLSEEELTQIQSETTNVYGVFDKSATKGMKKLIGDTPEYEFKGELRVRIKWSDKTDIIVETFLKDLENINSNVNFDFQRGLATIKIENALITELSVEGTKYNVTTGLKRIKYEKLGIGEFMEEYRFYENDEKVEEFKEYIIVGNRRVDKPDVHFEGKEETIFILGENGGNCASLITDTSVTIRNNFNVAFIELNSFNANYNEINIGSFIIFTKLKNDEDSQTKISNIENTFNEMIKNVSNNLTLEKTIHYVGLLVLSKFMKSKGFREKLHQVGKQALDDYYLNMPERNIELKEIDKLGIEFKAGIRAEGQGFFDASAERFSKKLLDKIKRKRKDTIIFFVGINEDTRNLSPIPLNRIRNEFHESLKEYLSKNGINVLLSETIPISEKEGILILILQKGG